MKKFSDILSVLIKWKNFILINFIVLLIILLPGLFLMKNYYRATSTVMLPSGSELGLGGLSSLIGGKTGSIGSKLLGLGTSTSEDMVLGLLNSRLALKTAIDTFNLMSYYEIEDNNYDKAIKSFREDLTFTPNEYGFIEISVVNHDPRKSAEISNFFIELMDSLNIKLNIEQAKNNRVFIEKRYQQNIQDLKNAEDSMYILQAKYGVFAVPEQFEVAVKSAAELEKNLIEAEIALKLLENGFSKNSPEYQAAKMRVDYFKDRISELKKNSKLSDESNIFFPFSNIPKISLEYFRLFRNVEIQQQILEIVLPLYEQAKVEEQKSIPTVLVVDYAPIPQEKYSPRRSFIFIGISLLYFFIIIIIVLIGHNALKISEPQNLVEAKQVGFFKKIVKLYRIKV